MKNILNPELQNPDSQISEHHYEGRTVLKIKGWAGEIVIYRPCRKIFSDNTIEKAYIGSFSWTAKTSQEALDMAIAVAHAAELMTEWNDLLDLTKSDTKASFIAMPKYHSQKR